jgi:hypothetical protein
MIKELMQLMGIAPYEEKKMEPDNNGSSDALERDLLEENRRLMQNYRREAVLAQSQAQARKHWGYHTYNGNPDFRSGGFIPAPPPGLGPSRVKGNILRTIDLHPAFEDVVVEELLAKADSENPEIRLSAVLDRRLPLAKVVMMQSDADPEIRKLVEKILKWDQENEK